ncbi:MAG: hypothetical protein FJ096_16270 [Deltaproteobacteria bacterium]|nr:hypothetical protein [Deltaproteobacteria bacterium]
MDSSRISRNFSGAGGALEVASSTTSAQGGAGFGGSEPTDCTEATVATACGLDSNCRTFSCVEGTCRIEDTAPGTPCDDDNGTTCDGKGNCVEAHCANGTRDVDETGIDCGGSVCAPCAVGAPCAAPGDCATGFCQASSELGGARATGTCAECTDLANCQSGEWCDVATGSCGPRRATGTACSASEACLSGHCVDGVCCDLACAGTCAACVASKTGGTDGACAPVLAMTDPEGECPTSTSGCRAGGCAGTLGACAPAAAGTTCRPAVSACDAVESCDGNVAACPVDAVAKKGKGTCPVGAACDGVGAESSHCKLLPGGACTVAGECLDGTCDAGSCSP